MLSPRWRKVLRDLAGYRTRTLLVVLCLAVGTFAVGVIAGTRAILAREMAAAYRAIGPAHAVLYTNPFAEDLLPAARSVEGVAWAEARRSVLLRARAGAGAWRDLELVGIPDFRDMRVNRIRPWRGAWPPPERELLLEREAVRLLGADVGATLEVQTARGDARVLRVAGLAHDLTRPPAIMAGQAYGYVTLETLAWLGEPRAFDELHLRVAGDPGDRDAVRRVAEAVRDRLERAGTRVHWIWLPDPERHPAEDVLSPLLLLLGALGGLSLLAAAFLAVNTVHAVLVQQVRQIGVMKALGADALHVAGIYLGMVLALGLLAAGLALPLSALGARALSAYIARLANTDIASFAIPAAVFAAQGLVGVALPLLTGLVPVAAASRMPVREALASYGIATAFGRGALDRLLERLRGLPRPLVLSLRNGFRRKARLALTLGALTLAGAVFVSVFGVRASLLRTLDEALAYWQYDVEVRFARPYRVEALLREARSVPGVAAAESWSFGSARRGVPGGGEESLLLVALPPDTRLLRPTLVAGRWLLPGDENALVLNSEALKRHPGLDPGDEVELRLDGKDTRWRVVGVVRGTMAGPMAYVPYGYFSRLMGSPGRAGGVMVVGTEHSPEAQRRLARLLEGHFRSRGYAVRSVESIAFHRERIAYQFNVLTGFLLVMALLLAAVGALGLAGTLSLNVLERSREIGVMRAIGADDGDIRRLVLAEGWVIGGLSAALAGLLALPLSRLLSDAVGYAFMQAPLSFRFAPEGVALWLAVVALLATLAGLLPAWQAARLSIREVLAYE